MKKQNNSGEDKYLVDDVACAYETRIPEGSSSRNLAFLPFGLGILVCGLGIFLAHDASMGNVAFWSNPVVLFGIFLSIYCNCIGLAMLFGKWTWTAIQMGLVGLCMLAIYYSISGASLADILLYGTAPPEIKSLLFVLSIVWNGYWVFSTVRGCRAIWKHELLRQIVWVTYRDAVLYRRSGAKVAMDKVGIKAHPSSLTMMLAFLLIVPLFWWRMELSILFGVPFVHVFTVLVGQSVAVIGWIFFVQPLMLMIYYPLKIKRSTGKPVLLDMMTRVTAPIPTQAS